MRVKHFDPFFWYLYLAHKKFFASHPTKEEADFAYKNINKHRLVQWINVVAIILIYTSLRQTDPAMFGLLINALIAPVMLLGGAWFAITFGAVPAKYFEFTLQITTWMYAAFKVAISAMFLSILFVSPLTLLPVLLFIYVAIDFASIPYDTTDGLKAGLDEMALKHSRAAIVFYERKGIKIGANDSPER